MEQSGKSTTGDLQYENELINENEELSSKEYLGTFRWKKSIKFPKLSDDIAATNSKSIDYSSITKWSEFIEGRIDFEIEPFIIDALSYPMSIIYAVESLRKANKTWVNKLLKEQAVNLAIIGASQKAEARIALESNYFDEIYNYFLCINNNPNFELKLFFVGEEVKCSSSYTSKKSTKLTYNFFNANTGDFLKENVLSFSKTNTLFVGLNCGFGAGYLKLTNSWVKDLIKLLKFNYMCIFTYTNNYEDMVGEYSIIKDLLGGEIILQVEDNPFKSMTTYKNEEDLWSCGNYGFYAVHEYNKPKLNDLVKLSEDKLAESVAAQLSKGGIKIK